jgi:hypothetical protein
MIKSLFYCTLMPSHVFIKNLSDLNLQSENAEREKMREEGAEMRSKLKLLTWNSATFIIESDLTLTLKLLARLKHSPSGAD